MDDQLGKARVRGLGPGTRPGADTPVAQNNTSKFNDYFLVVPEIVSRVSAKS